MSDRSDEVTESRESDAPATDNLLEETDRLLSESGVDIDDGSPETGGTSPSAAGGDTGPDSLTGFDYMQDAEPESDEQSGVESDTGTSRSWLSPVTSRLSLGRYFSPKAYVALVGVLSAGVLAGTTVLPFAGRMIGMFTVAFTVGLLASKRRYLEMSAAGVSVGAVAAVLGNIVLTAVGSGQSLIAVGATVGLLASVVGYYFGRDLRDGLSQDID
ncbi:DUF456 domain-containing protein [Natrinema zhouii]|uniref:DUF456 domain-containing protein n=1 Tax=Natrinema zhouii TaxID=1710539 RepID=A0A7D6GVP8_9EURY|nr:DUF456 domain-containing protein [Natrinema zhouii]QLK25886.1 DUF456 domain-containing protein [Natrinema zhouii]